MDFNLLTPSDDFIECKFFVYISPNREIFCGESLDKVKHNVNIFYSLGKPLDEDGKEMEEDKFEEMVNNIKEEDLEPIEIKLKRPNYSENSFMFSRSTILDRTSGRQIVDVPEYAKQRILITLKDWNLIDGKTGKKKPINEVTVGSLHPSIVESIYYHIEQNIPHYVHTA